MNKTATLETILFLLKEELAKGENLGTWDEKCLYAEKTLCHKSRYSLSDQCIPAAGTTVDEDDIEHLPPEIKAMGLDLYCYGQDLVDVVSSAIEQRPRATAQELLQALNYHSIHDSFIDFSEIKKRPKKWSIGVFPRFSADQLKYELSERNTDVLSRGQLLEYPSGSVLIEGGDSEIISLCNLISWQSGWALYLYISMPSAEKAGYWDHTLYQKHPISPIANPEDGKKIKQPRLIANIDAFLQAFPGIDPKILAQYFQSDFKIADAQRRWAQYMIRRHSQKGWQPPDPLPVQRVQPSDKYNSDDWRQVFDFLRYLGFPLENELTELS